MQRGPVASWPRVGSKRPVALAMNAAIRIVGHRQRITGKGEREDMQAIEGVPVDLAGGIVEIARRKDNAAQAIHMGEFGDQRGIIPAIGTGILRVKGGPGSPGRGGFEELPGGIRRLSAAGPGGIKGRVIKGREDILMKCRNVLNRALTQLVGGTQDRHSGAHIAGPVRRIIAIAPGVPV